MRPERSAYSASMEATFAFCGSMTRVYSASARERTQASAVVRALSASVAACARATLASTSWRVIEPVRVRREGSMLSQTSSRHPKWVGGPPRRALGDTGAVERSPWVRSEPEPEIARSAEEATGEGPP